MVGNLESYFEALRVDPDFLRLVEQFERVRGNRADLDPHMLFPWIAAQYKPKPLNKLVILDFSQGLAGPYATKFFADLGALVIKIEPKEVGDWSRKLYPAKNGGSAVFNSANAGKKSVTLNPNDPHDLAIIKSMVPHADILVQSFTPGDTTETFGNSPETLSVMARWGLDFASVKKINPNIIYTSISALGQSQYFGGTDPLINVYSGLADLNGGKPIPLFILDITTGLLAAQNTLIALYKQQSDEIPGPRHLDISLASGSNNLQAVPIELWNDGKQPVPVAVSAPSGILQCQNSKLMLTILRPEEYDRLCDALDSDALRNFKGSNEHRANNNDQIKAILNKILAAQPFEHWEELLRHPKTKLQISKYHTPEEYYELQSRKLHISMLTGDGKIITSPTMPSTNPDMLSSQELQRLERLRTAEPPQLGQHTEEILHILEARVAAYNASIIGSLTL